MCKSLMEKPTASPKMHRIKAYCFVNLLFQSYRIGYYPFGE
ncbi:hypothetical protein L293_2255 [Acinetobacter gyllenbergii CIP 110306 = MTCC 11365]|nr:hypothetical protein L293_2255 [Acinetobacter gyllenbergii CIP 110306 = MTCC 11365]